MRPNQQIMALNTEAAHTYHAALAGSPGEEYLAHRGLLEGAEQFKLGWVERPVAGHEDRFIHTVSVPYMTQAGCVGLKFRRIDDSTPKYDQMPGQKAHLFNVSAIIDAVDCVLITEGELDAVAATIAGLPACGVAGANNWKPWWRRVFDGIERVIIVTDNDDKADGSNPGQDLARRISDSLPNGVRVSLPAGHDVCSMIEAYGAQAFVDLVEAVR
jgi:DNA primase